MQGDAVRGSGGACLGDQVYLFILFKRGALHAYYTPAQFRLTTARDRVSTYQWRFFTVHHHHCAICGCPTYSESPDWSTGQPDFSNPRMGVNARLLDDFDLDTVEIKVIDGKNLW